MGAIRPDRHRRGVHRRRGAHAALAALCALIVGVIGVVVAPAPSATAATQPAGSSIRVAQTFYAYTAAGEQLSIDFAARHGATTSARVITVLAPDGTLTTCELIATVPGQDADCSLTLSSTVPGVWTIGFAYVNAQTGDFDWRIEALNGGTPVPGRVWSDLYTMVNTNYIDVPLWYVGATGHQYAATYYGYMGVDSSFGADQFGIVNTGTCVSAYESRGIENQDRLSRAAPECGVPYHVFFEAPAADLPASAVDGAGTNHFVAPPVQTPTIDALTFTPDSAATRAGTFTFDAPNHVGNAILQIDANGDGDLTDPEDREIPISIDGATTQSVPFDGLDGLGQPIAPFTAFAATVSITQAGEIHFINDDVEARSGITVTALNGQNAGTSTLYWNDSTLAIANHTANCLPPIMDGRAGYDSAAAPGVHGWPCNPATNPNTGTSGPWGDVRQIDDWTFNPLSVRQTVTIPATSNFTVVKTSDPESGTSVGAGDVVTYTVEVAQIGNAPALASFADDLSGVLDDASFNDDAFATAGDVQYDAEHEQLVWNGTLPVGGTATVSYSVTVTGAGDTQLRNVVTSAGCAEPDACQTEHPVGGFVYAKSSDADPEAAVRPGDEITYTIVVTQAGAGNVTGASLADDLSAVLDDATFNDDAVASAGSVTRTGDLLVWSGDLLPGDIVTITYSVTVTGGGDGRITNVVTSEDPRGTCLAASECTTTHTVPPTPTTPPTPGLPVTGLETPAGAFLAAGALAMLGAVLIASRSRRARTRH